MFRTPRGESSLAALTVALLTATTSGKGTANANHTARTSALPTGGNKCLGHKYITTAS